RIGNPARWQQALDALKESNGHLTSVTDEEIFDAYRQVSRREGVFCEPSSAAGLAGLRKAVLSGEVQAEGQTIVCVLTGHGLKDPASATEDAPPIMKIAGNLDALMEAVA
ncbi:pyridoxal-phosphate dependent enzyme, partial [bacterium]